MSGNAGSAIELKAEYEARVQERRRAYRSLANHHDHGMLSKDVLQANWERAVEAVKAIEKEIVEFSNE